MTTLHTTRWMIPMAAAAVLFAADLAARPTLSSVDAKADAAQADADAANASIADIVYGAASMTPAIGGDGTEVCDAASAGLLRFDQAGGALEVCADEAWQTLTTTVTSSPVAYVKDVKPNGTHGGDCPKNIWTQRELNQLSGDPSFITLVDNQITLQPGTYLIEGSAPAFVTSMHKAKLSDVTSGETIILGTNGYSHNSYPSQTTSVLADVVELSEPTTIELLHRCSNQRDVYGLGIASNYGINEVYSWVKIVKLD